VRRVWVHIADAAALVLPDSPADLEARARGANLYLPEGTVPILPDRALALLGLGLNEVSPALSFCLEIDSEGGVANVGIVPSWVRVQRLTYEQAETRLGEEPFLSLYQIAQGYQARRHQNGAISVDLPETIVRVMDGEVMIRPVLPLRSRDMVREAMLMAGEAAANFALLHQIPFAFASQEASTPLSQDEKLNEAAIPVLATGAGSSWEENFVQQYALRRGMKRGQVNTVPKPHAGLGLAAYARTTSPLRRYLDLVVHQQIRAFLHGSPLLDEQALLERVGASEAITGTVSATESRARRHWTLVYLLRHPQWHGEGVLVEKYGGRGRMLVPELALEIQINLRQDWPLGTRLPLRLTGVNLPELEVYFQAG